MLDPDIQFLSGTRGHVDDQAEVGVRVLEPLRDEVEDVDVGPASFVGTKPDAASFRLGEKWASDFVQISGKD
jgi:hypothetical protein